MTKTLADFIREEMFKREFTSNRQFADWVGVGHTTINMILNPVDDRLPSLDLLIKLARATGVDICNLVALVVPSEVTNRNVQAQLIAERIAALPPDKQALIDSLLVGMYFQRGENTE